MIVSPLIALMDDQVAAMRQLGSRRERHCTPNCRRSEEARHVYRELDRG